MTITSLTIENSRRNGGSVHCQDCWKILKREEGGSEELTQEAVDLLFSTAYHHELLHKTHNMTVTVYKKSPPNAEDRSG